MPWYLIVIIVVSSLLGLLLLLYVAVSIYFVVFMSYPKRLTNEEGYIIDFDKGLFDGIEDMAREPITLTMSDGYKISADISTHPNCNKWIISSHGYSWVREGNLKYTIPFFHLGYNILMYDERSHGKNIHKDCTMGHKEAHDLHEIILWLRKTYGEDIHIGTHGESMGGATVLIETRYKDKLDFIIDDCGYGDMRRLCENQLDNFHVPHFILPFCNLLLKIFHGYSFKDTTATNFLKENETPLLIMHGKDDDFVLPYHADLIYKAQKGYKEIYYWPNSKHAESIIKNKDDYMKAVISFLDKIYKEEK